MNIGHETLKKLARSIFRAAGCGDAEAERVGHYLVEANLMGHDSHGVIRIPSYVEWVRTGLLLPNQTLQVVFENEAIAIVDGRFGFGQVMGEAAMKLAIDKAGRHGVAVVALRNSGHIGQIGAWALMAAEAGKLSLHFVNTSGAGILMAPFGGTERRLSANPIAAGVPMQNGPPLILDMSTSVIAEGKIRVALNKGVQVAPNQLLDAEGRPTTDPKTFYGPPGGAILPVGGHKGSGMGVITEVLAGALTGGSCSTPGVKRVVNNMLTIVLDPAFFAKAAEFFPEIDRFVAFVKSSKKTMPNGEILMPGEFEARTRARLQRDGIDLDDTTWGQIQATCRALNVPVPGV
jgi:uncharacterized oxidoreductase